MISALVLRSVARTLAAALILADTILATRVPQLPDWEETGNPTNH